MSKSTLAAKLGTTLLAAVMAYGAWAQTVEAPPAPEVGDKWTYRFHNKGDKREPYLFINQVKFLDGGSAWILNESQQIGAQVTRSVWRYDLKRADYVERFDSDPAAANGASLTVAHPAHLIGSVTSQDRASCSTVLGSFRPSKY